MCLYNDWDSVYRSLNTLIPYLFVMNRESDIYKYVDVQKHKYMYVKYINE